VQPAFPLARVLLLVLCALPPAVRAQGQARVNTEENFRMEPRGDGRVLGRVRAGTDVQVGATRDGWSEVTLEGWIWARSTRAASNRDYDLVVSTTGAENLRAAPSGDVIARLETGTFLDEVSRDEGWIRVRRTAWMWGRSLDAPRAAAASAPAAEPARPPAGATRASLDQRSLAPGARLLATPGGDTLGVMSEGGTARVVASADGWARVLVEGWVREADLGPADDGALTGVTAAEVRGGGNTYVGRVLRWTVQLIALQTADELRRDLPQGQPYMLARGPLPEAGFVYVVLTPEQQHTLAALDPLVTITMLGRVRTARSQYLGNPVLDLLEFSVPRQP